MIYHHINNIFYKTKNVNCDFHKLSIYHLYKPVNNNSSLVEISNPVI